METAFLPIFASLPQPTRAQEVEWSRAGQMFMMWSAVNRVSRSGEVIGAAQRVSPLEALKAMTIDAARQYGEEASKGSLAGGKLADLVILNPPAASKPNKAFGVSHKMSKRPISRRGGCPCRRRSWAAPAGGV